MISKHYILLFQQNFIWFYTKDKISVFSNSNPTKYSVDGQKLLHTLKTHPLERILGLSAKDIKNHFIPFDTDSIFLAMDTCASVTMTFAKDDFLSPLEPPSIHHIQGAGGLVEVKGVGTIKYVIQDDEGVNHDLIIKNALYVPTLPFRLFSINQFSQQNEPSQFSEGTGIFSFGWHSKFLWNNKQNCKTIIHPEGVRIPLMRVGVGNSKYTSFLATCKNYVTNTPDSFVALRANELKIPTTDIQDLQREPVYSNLQDDFFIANAAAQCIPCHQENTNINQTNNINPPSLIQHLQTNTSPEITPDQQELLSWHNRLGHLSFRNLQKLAEQGSIPKRLAKTKAPLCLACLFGTTHKKPWRSRGKNKKSIRSKEDIFPGDNTSIDSLSSPTPSLMPQ